LRAELHLDLEAEVRRIVAEEISRAVRPDGLFNVKRAAEYLDLSEEALRGLLKRRQIECRRSVTGRITFTRDQLDRHAAGDAA
jgi:predicted HTH domain antitoxin